jgi:hypothetical protein
MFFFFPLYHLSGFFFFLTVYFYYVSLSLFVGTIFFIEFELTLELNIEFDSVFSNYNTICIYIKMVF